MKKLIGFLIALVVIVLGASVGTYVLIDQKVVRDNVAQAFHKQTGLDLEMDNASFQVIPWPSFHAGNVVLRRQSCTPFVEAKSVYADVSLLALLHRELSFQNFTVNRAKVTFQRTREGQCSSWLPFKTDKKSSSSTQSQVEQSPRARWKISFDSLHVSQAQLSWQDERHDEGGYQSGSFLISSLDLRGMRSISPWIDLRAQHGETPFTFKGRMGPFHRVLSASAQQGSPWSFSLGLTFGEGQHQDQMTMDGSMTDPHRLEGMRLSLQGHWENLSYLEGLFPHIGLPPVRGVSGMIDVREREDGEESSKKGFAETFSTLSTRLYPVQMHVNLGSVSLPQGTLGVEAPLHLRQLKMDANAPLSPLSINGEAEWGRFTWLFQANLGTLEKSVAAWSDAQHPTVPLDMTLQGRDKTLVSLLNNRGKQDEVAQNGVHFQLKGNVGRQSSRVTVKGQADMLQVPDLPGVKAGVSGAVLNALTIEGQLATGAFSSYGLQSLAMEDVKFDSREIGGDGRFSLVRKTESTPTSVDAHFHLSHFDGDALTPDTSMDATTHQPHFSSDEKKENVRDNIQALLSSLHTQHVMLELTADQLRWSGVDYRDSHIVMVLGGDHLLLEPMSATVDGVPLTARVAVDGTLHPALFHIKADPWIIPSKQLLQFMGQTTPVLDGAVQLDGDVSAQGDNVPDLVASLNGMMGLSLVNGEINTSVLAPLAGPAASFLKLGKNTLSLRCAAVHFKLNQGKGVFDTLGLQTKHFVVRGQGSVGLKDGALSMHIVPHVSLAGNTFSVPMQVNGTVLAPEVGQLPTADIQNQIDLGTEKAPSDPCQDPIQKARNGHEGSPIPAIPDDHSQTGSFLKALGIGGK